MSFLTKHDTGVWVIDVQEHLFPHIDRANEVLERMCFFLEAARFLRLPMIVTEQYPPGLGGTLPQIKDRLPQGQVIYPKTSFSGFFDPTIRTAVEKTGVRNWILMGFEAHICVLQTAKDLVASKQHAVVLNDAVSSRSLYDFSTAMGELRECNVRISSAETIVYELIRDAHTPEFKGLLPLVKAHV